MKVHAVIPMGEKPSNEFIYSYKALVEVLDGHISICLNFNEVKFEQNWLHSSKTLVSAFDKKIGPAQARNMAIKTLLSSGDVKEEDLIIFLDNDIQLNKQSLEDLIELYRQNDFSVISPNVKKQIHYHFLGIPYKKLNEKSMSLAFPSNNLFTPFVDTCFMLTRASIFIYGQAFDVRFRRCEDKLFSDFVFANGEAICWLTKEYAHKSERLGSIKNFKIKFHNGFYGHMHSFHILGRKLYWSECLSNPIEREKFGFIEKIAYVSGWLYFKLFNKGKSDDLKQSLYIKNKSILKKMMVQNMGSFKDILQRRIYVDSVSYDVNFNSRRLGHFEIEYE